MEVTTTRINTFRLVFDIKAGGFDTKQFEIIVFRTDIPQPDNSVTITYRIWNTWQIWDNNTSTKKIAEKREYLDFSDYFEADSKYQHLCLKAFSESMSKRQVY